MTGWQREAIALGYQLGALILPTLIPVVPWAAFNAPFIERTLLSRARNSLPVLESADGVGGTQKS